MDCQPSKLQGIARARSLQDRPPSNRLFKLTRLVYRAGVSVFTSDPQWVQVTNRSPESTQSSSPQFQQIKIVLMCPKTSAWSPAPRFETLGKHFTVSRLIACDPLHLRRRHRVAGLHFSLVNLYNYNNFIRQGAFLRQPFRFGRQAFGLRQSNVDVG
jgi:hypothetical protein